MEIDEEKDPDTDAADEEKKPDYAGELQKVTWAPNPKKQATLVNEVIDFLQEQEIFSLEDMRLLEVAEIQKVVDSCAFVPMRKKKLQLFLEKMSKQPKQHERSSVELLMKDYQFLKDQLAAFMERQKITEMAQRFSQPQEQSYVSQSDVEGGDLSEYSLIHRQFQRQESALFTTPYERLDIAVLWSSPLVKGVKGNYKPYDFQPSKYVLLCGSLSFKHVTQQATNR